jgi:MFS family permease
MSSIKSLSNKIFQKEVAPVFLLVLNTFIWYLLTFSTLSYIITQNSFENQSLFLFAAYFLGIAVAAIAGSMLPHRLRSKLLNTWIFLGAFATLCLVLVSPNTLLVNLLVISFLGISIGLGLPSCLSYFAKKAKIEKRGLIAGAIWSTLGVMVLVLGLVISVIGTLEVIMLLVIWRLIGGFIFVFLTRKEIKFEPQKSPGYFSLIRKREVLLFLLPWIIFNVINFTEGPMLKTFFGASQYNLIEISEFVFIGIFAFIGGLLADTGGRKRVIIAGFVMLGIEYATLSVFSDLPNPIMLSYIFMAIDGITWGLFFSVFFTVVWGDLGENYEKEKFYAIGGIPLLLTNFLSVLVAPYTKSIPLGTAFTVASFFLFVAVIPLMYAPETLPEKALKDRDLKSYIEKAKKVAQKTEQNEQKNDATSSENEEKENNEDYEEARKLAEKYY